MLLSTDTYDLYRPVQNSQRARPSDHLNLIVDMGYAGAIHGAGKDYHVPPSPALSALMDADHLRQSPHNHRGGFYTLSPSTSNLLRPATHVTRVALIHEYCRDAAIEDMSVLELALKLIARGWHDEPRPRTRTRSIAPFKPDGNKVWYRDPSKPISKHYLRSLLKAGHLFKKGVAAIHHARLES